MQSNGCQVMPDMVPTVTVTVDASAATLSPGQMVAKAIKAVSEATATNEGVGRAWVHYHGDSSSCTKTALGGQHEMCENAPPNPTPTPNPNPNPNPNPDPNTSPSPSPNPNQVREAEP